jgi:hypothetical protein
MTEQRSPDEEPIIELTEVVEPSAAADEDIIELTEVVEASAAADEEIIELTEVVEFKPAADEDIIELTDIVKSPPAEEAIDLVDVAEEASPMDAAPAGEMETGDVAALSAADDDEQPHPAIDQQKNQAEASAGMPEDTAFDLLQEDTPKAAASDGADPDPDDELDFAPMDLDIEEHKEEDLFDSLGMKLEPELQGAVENDELDFNLSTQELSDAIDLLDAKLAEEPPAGIPAGDDPTPSLPSAITEAQVEKALENVIRQMYKEKIDQLLNEAIEKTVAAEIEDLKQQLLNEAPQN